MRMAFHVSTSDTEQQAASRILQDTFIFPQNLGEPGSDPTYFLPEPRGFHEIIRLPMHQRMPWINAMIKEIKGLVKRGTFSIEKPPPGIKAYLLLMVLKCKLDKNGFVHKLKARAVFRGDLVPHDDIDTWTPNAS